MVRPLLDFSITAAIASIGAAALCTAGICHLICREWQVDLWEEEIESREALVLIKEEILRRDVQDHEQAEDELAQRCEGQQRLHFGLMESLNRRFVKVGRRELAVHVREKEVTHQEKWLLGKMQQLPHLGGAGN
jgi:hypothetical protein